MPYPLCYGAPLGLCLCMSPDSLDHCINYTYISLYKSIVNYQGWNSPLLDLCYLCLLLFNFLWKTPLEENTEIVKLGESQPSTVVLWIPNIDILNAFKIQKFCTLISTGSVFEWFISTAYFYLWNTGLITEISKSVLQFWSPHPPTPPPPKTFPSNVKKERVGKSSFLT